MTAKIYTSHHAHSKALINSEHCPTVVSREYKLADHVTDSKEEFSLEKVTVHSAGQLTSHLLRNPKCTAVFTKSLTLDHILNDFYPVHIFTSYVIKK
jgi:hypothetical protein